MSHSQDSLIGRRHSSLRSLPRVLQVCAGSLAGAPPLSPSRTASQQTEADLSRKTPAQGARPPSLLTETRPDQPTDPGLTPVRSQVGADISLPCDSESFTILLPLRLRGAETQKPQVRRPGARVREGGFEPPRPCGHWHLKPARLPFRHSRVSRPTGTTAGKG